MKWSFESAWNWIAANPNASKSFGLTAATMLFKLYMQVSGASDDLDKWNAAAGSTLDFLIFIVAGLGVWGGVGHTAAGPLVTQEVVKDAVTQSQETVKDATNQTKPVETVVKETKP